MSEGMSATLAARRLVDVRPSHPVVSFYLDLDPERFATPPARASQIRSLLDQARREVEQRDLAHEDRQALREDLERIDRYLAGDDAPYQGARGLAIFCSLRDDLFEVVQLPRPIEARVMIERTAFVEPLVRGAHDRRWCVALVSRRSARVLSGLADRLEERQRIEDNVHGQHEQGGWSQSRYERSADKEADDHLRRVAEMLHRRWRRDGFDRLALGGPTEAVRRLESMLHEELRPLLSERRVEVDVTTASEDTVRGALARLAEEDERARERAALDRLAEGLGREARAASGVAATLAALGERRVGTLLLEPYFAREGARCPRCGLLLPDASAACPVDGVPVEPLERLCEAVVEAALTQDAEIIFVRHAPDLASHEGIAALLRF
jgi:peptide subunit release factor 1 (eRF1)